MGQSWIVGLFSTGYDLEEHRKAIIAMLKEKKITVSAYELPEFPVEVNRHSHDSCLVALDRIDIAILIINKRSGGIYYGSDKENQTTITETEYIKAIEQGKPVFVFVKQEAFDELYAYKKGFDSYCKNGKIEKGGDSHKKFDAEYVCAYVDNVKTLHFIDDIQHAYPKYGVSNWMDRFDSIDDLKECVRGKLEGYSRALVQQLAEKQKDSLLNRHTSTSIGMSLRDVFSNQYYIDPPHRVVSGDALITSNERELSKCIENILSNNKSVLVFGEAGYGKTTIIAKCFSSHVDSIINQLTYDIPLFLPLRNKGSDYNFDLIGFINEEFEELFNKEPYPYFNISGINVRFYCDGFDELAESLSEDDLERIRNSQIFKYPLFLTCRKQFLNRYLNVHNFSDVFAVRIQMEKWNLDTVKEYLAVYCNKKNIGEERKNRILSLINGNLYFQQLIDTPLLMTMFLGFLESDFSNDLAQNISAVDLFKYWMDELSSREHASKSTLSSELILSVWKTTAWHLYLSRVRNERLLMEDLMEIINDSFPSVREKSITSTFDALFEKKANCIVGTFHEQFMEYLVASLLIDACQKKNYPYPDFLELVLRPEINRYFREIWKKQSRSNGELVYSAISDQYFNNTGKNNPPAISVRAHAAYHFCRLGSDKRIDTIDRAFETEKSIPVLQSLYFGAIKLGQLDKEEEFYQLLQRDEFSRANRGYHLTYYADIIQNGVLPYNDDDCSDWQGTLEAVERHFESDALEHYFLWRIDLFTINELIQARKNVGKLTRERLVKIGDCIRLCRYNNSPANKEYCEKVLFEYQRLYNTWECFS